jgi:hypothetical protein
MSIKYHGLIFDPISNNLVYDPVTGKLVYADAEKYTVQEVYPPECRWLSRGVYNPSADGFDAAFNILKTTAWGQSYVASANSCDFGVGSNIELGQYLVRIDTSAVRDRYLLSVKLYVSLNNIYNSAAPRIGFRSQTGYSPTASWEWSTPSPNYAIPSGVGYRTIVLDAPLLMDAYLFCMLWLDPYTPPAGAKRNSVRAMYPTTSMWLCF